MSVSMAAAAACPGMTAAWRCSSPAWDSELSRGCSADDFQVEIEEGDRVAVAVSGGVEHLAYLDRHAAGIVVAAGHHIGRPREGVDHRQQLIRIEDVGCFGRLCVEAAEQEDGTALRRDDDASRHGIEAVS